MSAFLDTILLLALLPINSIGPGLLLLRRLRLKPQERFCAAVGLSLFVDFCVAFLIYAIKAPAGCYWLITVIGALSTFATRDDLRTLFRSVLVRGQVKAYCVLFLLAFCMLALIRHYSGGMWAGDWIEHYDRARFFLDHHASDEVFIERYALPARPPMMNVLAAAYMAQVGTKTFAIFSQVFLLLNLLVVLPCVLLLPLLGARHFRPAIAAIVFLLAANPMFMQNTTWTWTKLLTVFYALLALRLYVRGWRESNSGKTIAAFGFLAIGTLVHYSTGPYIVVLLMHYAVVVMVRRPKRWMEPAIAGGLSVAVLTTWFAWSLAVYGWTTTFKSNTTITDSSKLTFADNVGKMLRNIEYSFVPFPFTLKKGLFAATLAQDSGLGYLRDWVFCIYQQNAIFTMGSLGGLVILGVLIRQLFFRGGLRVSGRLFWGWLVLGSTFLGIASHGTEEILGVAHVVLQPMLFLGLILLASSFAIIPKWLRIMLVGACMADFSVGVLLQATMEHRDFVTTVLRQADGQLATYIYGAGLNQQAIVNWAVKSRRHLHFLGDDLQHLGAILQIILVELMALLAFIAWRHNLSKPRDSSPRRRKTIRELLPRSRVAAV